MIRLPVLTELKVTDYGLFPGNPRGSGIVWSFRPGLSLIVGINGLGKTTLLTMILRSLTGPYDLTGDGEPGRLKVILPEKPASLRSQLTSSFGRRVADGAENAKVELSAEIGKTKLTILRKLKDLYLVDLALNEQPVEMPSTGDKREGKFQSQLTELMGLSSFVDVLLVLHHLIFFHENRPGALWDPNAQRQLLRALCLDREDASRVAKLERDLQSADSQARNIHAHITSMKGRWRNALYREAGSESVLAEIEAEQNLLDAELMEVERLGEALEGLDDDRKDARLAHERAKIEREDAVGAIERLKYTKLLRHFPSMDDTTRLAMSRIMTDDRCLVCNASARNRRIELEQQVAQGYCPICGAAPESQDNVVAPHEFDQAKLERERKRAETAKSEEKTQSRQLQEFTDKYDQTLRKLARVRQTTEERKRKDQRLRSELPERTTSREYESWLKRLGSEHREQQEVGATCLRDLRSLLKDRESSITAKSNELVETFSKLIQALLVEEVRLVRICAEPRYMQAQGPYQDRLDRLQVPAYAAEMTAPDRPGFSQRKDPSEVSESQRELIDLAFRLTLIGVFGSPCTFVMETPEASLDGVAMERVGRALAAFSATKDNRLVVTSNLTNSGIIKALFGDSTPKEQASARWQHVLNLLEIAAPNRALLEDGERYIALLKAAVSGTDR